METTKISFTCKSKQLEDKTINADKLKERRRKDKEKQIKYYYQHTKEMKRLRYGETVRILRDGKWEPAIIVQEKADEPRHYILKTENGRTYR